jgi:hypothetical protein
MTKAESEKAIRHLCHVWVKEAGLAGAQLEHPSYSQFRSWVDRKGYSSYFKFRSVAGPEYDAELWFDEELKQSWRR